MVTSEDYTQYKIENLFEQFERQAINANFAISFSKRKDKTKYSCPLTQAMFEGWLLYYMYNKK